MDIAALNERVMTQVNTVVTDKYGNQQNIGEDLFF